MLAERTFVFSDQTGLCVRITVSEIADHSYGMYTWPCAPVLAQYIWFNRSNFVDKTVLELSAGTALPGMMAAKCGARVYLSDRPDIPHRVEHVERSCKLNTLPNMPIHGVQWGRLKGDVELIPRLDYIVTSDCFYNTSDFEDILVTVSFLLSKNKSAEFILTYQERSTSRYIEHLLHKWNLKASIEPLTNFDADMENIAESDLPGHHTIKLFKIILSP